MAARPTGIGCCRSRLEAKGQWLPKADADVPLMRMSAASRSLSFTAGRLGRSPVTSSAVAELALPTLQRHSQDRKRSRKADSGKSAASHCMNFSADITRCVVPSRQGVFSSSTTWPAALVGSINW